MKILALDPATNMGWAVRDNDGSIYSGVWHLGAQKKQNPSIRFLNLQKRLEKFENRWEPPDVLVYEAPGVLHGMARKILPGFQAIIEAWCLRNGVAWRTVSPNQVKQHATGKGTADKVMMMAAAKKRWPNIEFETHDQADALFVLDYFEQNLNR